MTTKTMDDVSIRAGHGRILLREVKEQERIMNGGLVLPGVAGDLQSGEVVSVGMPDKRYMEKCDLLPGDIVRYEKGAGQAVVADGVVYCLLMQVEALVIEK